MVTNQPMRCLTDAILCEPAAIACRYELPTGGAAVRAWVNPLSEWGARLASACRARCGELLRGRARPLQEPTR